MGRTAASAPANGPGSVPRSGAFTLIELLVVIVIVLVLAGLTLPGVRSVQGAARSSRCLSNLRMCMIATSNYLLDSEGFMPYHAEGGDGQWWLQRINPYIDSTYQNTSYTGNNVFHCAHAEVEVTPPWKFQDRFSFHFSMNLVVQGKWWANFGGTPDSWQRTNVHSKEVKPGTIVYADGKVSWNASGYYFWDEISGGSGWVPWPLDGGGFFGVYDGTNRDRRVVGHRGTVNRAFMDGHAAAISAWRYAEEGPQWLN